MKINKKALCESLMTSVSREVNKVLNEYRTKTLEVHDDITLADAKKAVTSMEDWVQKILVSGSGVKVITTSSYSDGLFLNVREPFSYEDVDKNLLICSLYIRNRYYYSSSSLKDAIVDVYNYMKTNKVFRLKNTLARAKSSE